MRATRIEAAARYRSWRYFYFYAHGKIAMDPAYPEVARQLSESSLPLLDIGCGIGLLASYLRASGHQGAIFGMDLDEEKIGLASQVLGHERAKFQAANALDFPEHSGDVVMLDVLHYFNDAEQQVLLKKIAHSVAPGGVALIRGALAEPGWRHALTRAEEWFVQFSRWIPRSGWNFPTREEVGRAFLGEGFHAEVSPMWGFTPFNSYLFTFRRAAVESDTSEERNAVLAA
ncbi:class I SAM-dependent methyltransferase [soil metagenome]